MSLNKQDQKELALKKHVASIHCSNTTLLQRKISNVLLYHAYDNLLEKEEHEIPIKILCQMIGYSSHDYETIKKALKALISTVLEWNLLGDAKTSNLKEIDWNASSILASVGIQNGICTYSYSHKMKKLLYMPEVYGRINLAIQSRFTSNYGLALYENCIRYQNLPFTRWFSIQTFRKLMGIPEGKYPIFRDFKKRVIDKSIEEVNEYSDIQIEPEMFRENRQVTKLRFRIFLKKGLGNNINDAIAHDPTDVNLKQQLFDELVTKFGVDIIQAGKMVKNYESSFIREKLVLLESSESFQNGKVHNITAYLLTALREDFQPNISSDQQIELARREKEVKREQKRHELASVEKLKNEYAEFVLSFIEKAISKIDEETRMNVEKSFEDHLVANKNNFVLKKFYRNGLNDLIVRSIYRNYIREIYPQLLLNLPSFAEFSVQARNN